MNTENKSFFDRINSIIVALIFAIFGHVVVAIINGRSNINLEQKKLQTQLIIQAVKTGDPKQAVSNLSFLIEAGLVDDPAGKIHGLISGQERSPSKSPSLVLPSEHISKGVSKAIEGKYDEAIVYYLEAIHRDPENKYALNLLGYTFFKKKQYIIAISYLERSVQIPPDEPWGHYNLSLALWANGDKDRAIQEVQKVLDLDPAFRDKIIKDGQFRKFYSSRNFLELIGISEQPIR